MKKSISSLVLAISASAACVSAAQAMPMPLPPGHTPPPRPTEYIYCLGDYGQYADGAQHVGDCDNKEKNALYGEPINAAGCAEGQVVIKTIHQLDIRSCPTAVQL